jgi:sugar phosphate isomerase/epimerase
MKTMKSKICPLITKALVITFFAVITLQGSLFASGNKGSKIGGVQVGTITYSFRSMPDQTITGVLNDATNAGLSSIELMGGAVEQYAGIPQSNDAQTIRQWRATVSMDKFKEIRKMFNKNGIKINILKLGDSKWSDEEIDYAFNVSKILGAKGITMEISEEAAARLEPFAEKHHSLAIFHNHGQPGDPNFSFDKVLAIGPRIMLNLDCGHYFGATGQNPCILIERLHNRIVSFHLKDKTGPKAATPNKNQVWGQGETPLAEILQFVQKKGYPITCDIELEYTIPEGSDAVKEVAKCLDYCRNALTVKK